MAATWQEWSIKVIPRQIEQSVPRQTDDSLDYVLDPIQR